MASRVRAGDAAPDFELTSGDGQLVRLSDYRGKSEVVLFFYPKDDSPACTAEACSFRDSYEDFLDAGAVVIGVSADPAGEHQAFAGKHRLPFPLLTDADGSLRSRRPRPGAEGNISPSGGRRRVNSTITNRWAIRHSPPRRSMLSM